MADKRETQTYIDIPLERVRNTGIIAHIDAGKTTITEQILFFTGSKHKIGRVDEGDTTTDYLEEERKRGVTIVSAAVTCFWKYQNQQHRINLIDTPGHVDFTAEVERSLRVLDGAVVIFDGKSGVQAQTETVWRQADKYNVPRVGFINKLNLIGGDFEKSLDSIRERLTPNVLPLIYPIGREHDLRGFVDLLTMQAYVYDKEEMLTLEKIDIPEDIKPQAEEMRIKMIEKVVELDDALLEQYLEGKEISVDDIKRVIRKGTIDGSLFPVAGGDARTGVVVYVLDMITAYLPSPLDLPPVKGIDPNTGEEVERKPLDEEPLAALVFKVQNDPHIGTLSWVRVYSGKIDAGSYVYNSTDKVKERVSRVVLLHANKKEDAPYLRAGEIGGLIGLKSSYTGDTLSDEKNPIILEKIEFVEPVVFAAVIPETKQDSDKLGLIIPKVIVEDPTITFRVDNETGQTIMGGVGEFHLQIWAERIQREYGVKIKLGAPQVAYREAISIPAEAEGKYIKQTGGRGQYGHVKIKIEPLEPGSGFEFVDQIKGGVVPREYIPAVEKGIKEAMQQGVVAGYPVVDVRVILNDGSYHEVDSSEAAFKIAGGMAFKEAMSRANPYLLEPVMKVEFIVPEANMGDVTGLVMSRRGKILNTEKIGAGQDVAIMAQLPLAETFDLANKLRAVTSGRGDVYMEFSHYEKVPKELEEKIKKGSMTE